jgi:hypothetical protein
VTEKLATASVDTSGIAREIQAFIAAQQPILQNYRDMTESIRKGQGTFADAQVVNAICAVIDDDNEFLAAAGVPAKCVGKSLGSAVGAIEIGRPGRDHAAKGVFPSGLWSLQARWPDKPTSAQRTERDQMARVREGLGYLVRAIHEGHVNRPAHLPIEVEGFASGVDYRCEKLASDLEGSTSSSPSAPGRLTACSGNKVDCFERTGDKGAGVEIHLTLEPGARVPQRVDVPCTEPEASANAALAMLRAWSTALELRTGLCQLDKQPLDACRWPVSIRETPASLGGTGPQENQRFRIYVGRKL